MLHWQGRAKQGELQLLAAARQCRLVQAVRVHTAAYLYAIHMYAGESLPAWVVMDPLDLGPL